ncbi:MAG: cupin domain-containing protein [Actinomycetota bacterium]
MPKTTKEGASDHVEAEGFEGSYKDLAGYTVGFETYTADADMAPLFVGLPDDRCQCPHMGYVLKGKLVYHYADGDDVIEGGEAYVAKPGHTPEIFAGTELVEFSPTDELAKTMEVVTKNMEAEG